MATKAHDVSLVGVGNRTQALWRSIWNYFQKVNEDGTTKYKSCGKQLPLREMGQDMIYQKKLRGN